MDAEDKSGMVIYFENISNAYFLSLTVNAENNLIFFVFESSNSGSWSNFLI